ncbi:ROK family protein [Streptomyces zaomyceticus]|uniref:ROK family protein n=1 Tax=Streptomyces zaomyceticus TaxID=68286 RepID=UPI003449A44D
MIALDVGGTSMKGALLDDSLRPLGSVRRPTPSGGGPTAALEAIITTLRELDLRASRRNLTVRHIGTVVPGIVDERTGRALRSADLGWVDLPLARLLAHATGRPVVLGHDVRAGGLAEFRAGAGRGVRDALFVAVGTGISAAVLSDGRPLVSDGYAGELGHMTVDRQGAACRCGGRGCLETVASAAAIAAEYSARSGTDVDGAFAVSARLSAGDPVAVAVWHRAVEALTAALADVSTLLAPRRIVLGGGLAEAGRLLLDPLRAGLMERLTFQRRPDVVRAAFGGPLPPGGRVGRGRTG